MECINSLVRIKTERLDGLQDGKLTIYNDRNDFINTYLRFTDKDLSQTPVNKAGLNVTLAVKHLTQK